ncbi:type IV pilin protein [Dyella sp. S184]|uniref:type IV pilin protein n=1 Tax=Dyella sp. S184 TaxID=1641862 RepID=UPI0031B6DCB4
MKQLLPTDGGVLFEGTSAPSFARHAMLARIWRNLGFTLIEMMIVVAIIAILAAIAYPAYTHYIIKTRRAAATACVSEYANYMERYYTTNMAYDKAVTDNDNTVNNELPDLDCKSAQQTGNYYDYDFGTPTASTYTITATPKGLQATDACGALTLDQTGARGPAASVANCW